MFSLYPNASSPKTTNSKNVFKFSGLGAETKIFEKPHYIAAARLRPIAADFP